MDRQRRSILILLLALSLTLIGASSPSAVANPLLMGAQCTAIPNP
jgi:hypothetical protein